MTDTRLKEKALAEDPNLTSLIKWGHVRETGREGAHCLKDNNTSVCHIQQNMNSEEIDNTIETLQVMKVRKQGKYSFRNGRGRINRSNCRNCTSDHHQGRCPASGKECYTCGGRNHFSCTQVCPGKNVIESRSTRSEQTPHRNSIAYRRSLN